MKNLSILLMCMLVSITAVAQEKTVFSARENTNKYVISIVPQSTAENALRIDIDKRLQNGTTLIIAPRFYLSQSSSTWEDESSSDMIGIGGEIFQKIRVNDLSKPVRAYFAYGILYNFYHVSYTETDWVQSSTIGVNTLVEQENEKFVNINKMGPSLNIGIEFEPIKRFVIDIGAGFGARYAFVSQGDKTYINNHSGILNMGYTGVLPLGVAKLGIVF
ncbi:MAG TPA: hypothetical protein PK734_02575 [Bacteroidales bacterium]|nr:MAG: hypothetical protein BWY22_01517 [Bacteroidetes bacterium ADurb.Bin217]HPM12358.1 hypothetical protein [Bacteroidales bacterium]